MTIKTADLCDKYENQLHVVTPMFRNYGGVPAFSGRIQTLKVHEDNKLVRSELEKNGAGRILVIDGGGSLRTALVGGNLAKLAVDNQWMGIIVNGCIRDSVEIAGSRVGVLALGTNPMKPKKNGFGEVGVPVNFGGAIFRPGEYVYADEDGVVISASALST